jgi:UDP:flavonoid glycosyltransferase YjiC (YdhE family)
MRILFSSRPSYGHVYPMMPLAYAAAAAGHHVEFATTGPFLDRLARLGFPVRPVGISIDDAALRLIAEAGVTSFPRDERGRPDLSFGGRMFADVLARATTSDLLGLFADDRPDVVVYEQGDLGAGIAAGLVEVPAVQHGISPQWPDQLVEDHLRPWLDGIWADHGVERPTVDVAVGDAYLDIFPRVLQEQSVVRHPHRLALRPVPWTEPGTPLPHVPSDGSRPLLYVTLGTVVANDDVLRVVLEGVSSLDAHVLVALGAAAGSDLGPLPDHVVVQPFLDQARLMPAVDLVVHHGGSGTVLGALAHGVPQLILPQGADQFFNGDLLDAAGLAEVVEPTHLTAEEVATAAKVALAEHRPGVDAVRAELAARPSPAEVMVTLEERFG